MKTKNLSLLIIFIFSSLLYCKNGKNFITIKKQLKGSEIMILKPTDWNGKLLQIAHGYRPESTKPYIDIAVDQFTQPLLDEGWMIAGSSYRRSGMIVRDAIEDISFLDNYIVENYGKPEEKYLLGVSMGAVISLLIVENESSDYNGLLALGAGLGSKDKENPLLLNYKPLTPVLFLSNNTETEPPLRYISLVEDGYKKPKFWIIDRPGHCNENPLELKESFNALLAMERGEKVEDNRTIIHHMQSEIESEGRVDGEKFLVEIHGYKSKFKININREDFAKIGIEYKSYFNLDYNGKNYNVYWGDTYGDVGYRDWIGFFSATGTFTLARNYGDAVSILKYKEGDEVIFTKIDNQPDNSKLYNQSAGELGVKSWGATLAKKPLDAITYAKKALAIEPDAHWIKVNLLHGYIFADQYENAKKLVLDNIGIQFKSKQIYFEDSVKEDFIELEKENLYHADMKRILELLE